MNLDALRTNLSVIPAATMCLEEDRMNAFKSTTVLRNCYCTPMGPGALPLHYHQDVIGNGTCFPVPVFQSIANLPTAPPTGFVQEYVGQWGLPAGLWPFKAHAWLANGIFDYSDITCAFPSLQPSFHFIRGGTIAYDTSPPSLSLFGGPGGLQLMTDVANSLLYDPVAMTQAPMVGTAVDAALLFQISR
ncbi:MAG TPA: hypothetical protein ENK17_03125 [Anaerolineae bacterium]|nr:hypothetical protein [Anaerolineae bacterium]